MKADIHPEYRFVVFRDVSSGFEFLTRSCADARETTEYNGQEYPLIAVDISSESHPFYTGTQKLLDTEGRVERFYRKYGFSKGDAGDAAEAEPAAPAAAEAEAPAVENETVEAIDESGTPADVAEVEEEAKEEAKES